jgi:hypothetical protein
MVNIAGAARAYDKLNLNAGRTVHKWMKQGGNQTELGTMAKTSEWLGHAGGNLQADAVANGRSVLGQMGSSAIRGAAFGGVIGGTTSALQGGSFWDGAKQGAFNGAVGWTAYRTGMRATGATSFNPFKGNNEGMLSAASTMWRAQGTGEVSKQAISILNNRQREGLIRGVMNANKRKNV